MPAAIIGRSATRWFWPAAASAAARSSASRTKRAAYPRTRPLTPADVHATVYEALGYDPHRITYKTLDGRPMLLSEGKPIAELL